MRSIFIEDGHCQVWHAPDRECETGWWSAYWGEPYDLLEEEDFNTLGWRVAQGLESENNMPDYRQWEVVDEITYWRYVKHNRV